MMTPTPIYTRVYNAPCIRYDEIRRYAGVRGACEEIEPILQSEVDNIANKLTYKVCYREFPVTDHGTHLDLGFIKTTSADLRRALLGCESIVLFAATVGMSIDRRIARYTAVSPTRALVLQAIGAERIESLCDRFCREIAEQKAAEGRRTRPRFSPGYGDLPLLVQTDIFAVLDPSRKIGLSLNESLLMSPSKSVTALIGVSGKEGASMEGSLGPSADI